MKKILTLAIAVAFACSISNTSESIAQENDAWGSLSGQVVIAGDAPTNPPEDVAGNKDKDICLVDGEVPLDDNIIVNSENNGLKDVFIMMYIGRGEDEPTYHPSFDEAKKQTVTIDNVKCRFEPHAMFVRTGQKFELKNSDTVGHNCHIMTFGNEENINLPAGQSAEVTLKETDKVPGKVVCDIHKWMDAVLYVRDNPYVAISDADGKFTIENIPAGDWKFQVWHVKKGFLKDMQVTDKEVGRRGEFDVTIEKDNETDLGTMTLAAEVLAE